MIDYQDKFDDLNDLPISEELLGAYAEGNLHGSEFREVQNCIQDNVVVSDLVNVVENELDSVGGFGISELIVIEPLFGSESMFADFALPEISSFDMESLIDPSSPLTDDIVLGNDSHNLMGDEMHFLHSEDYENNHHHDSELDFGMTDNNG